MLALSWLSEGGGGPDTKLLAMLLVGMAFFFLTIIIGWRTASRKQGQPEARPDAKKSARKPASK